MLSRSLWLLSAAALATAVNITYDDAAPAWTYDGGWGQITADHPCSVCVSQPNQTKAYDQTWHDLSSLGNATLSFTGIAIYLATICPGPHGDSVYVGNFTFKIDDGETTAFHEQPGGCANYTYNYFVFSATGLSNGDHTLFVTNAAADKSDLLIDYALVDDGKSATTTSSKKSLPVAAIAVPVVVVVLLALAIAVYLTLRRKRMARQVKLDETAPSPYKNPSIDERENHIPMAVYQRAPDSATTALANVQAAGNDPELEAALHIITSRARQNAQETTQSMHTMAPAPVPISSPTTGWSRDRKGVRPAASAAAQSSTAVNWSTSGTPSSHPPTTSVTTSDDDAVPPAYSDATRS